MADANLQLQNTVKRKGGYATFCLGKTALFWTALSVWLMSLALFGLVLANAVFLAREDADLSTQRSLATAAFSFAASIIAESLLHLLFARFDKNNRSQRLQLYIPLLVMAAAFLIHNVFWFVGIDYDPNSFPNPNSASYSIVGFCLVFILAFFCWYEAKYVRRLDV